MLKYLPHDGGPMASVPLPRFVRFTEERLAVHSCPERVSYLYVEGSERVGKACFALDATEGAVASAAEQGADLLFTHHPIAYGPIPAVTGAVARKLKGLLDGGLSLYSAHLPLDAAFNAPELARLLGVKAEGRFASFDGFEAGVYGRADQKAFPAAVAAASRASLHLGHARVRRVGVVPGSGAKASVVAEAAALGLDTLVTGERSYHGLLACEEAGLNAVFLGHYGSELPGLAAFMREAKKALGIRTVLYREDREY
jgi:dinuclear metal center YbgI/SA1388 family protein